MRTDQIGRSAFATNAAGTKVWTAGCSPFGGITTSTGTPAAMRFPGQRYQAATGLYQNWMRDYDPTTWRYLQADPLGLVDGASVYGYAREVRGGGWIRGGVIPLLVGALIGVGIEYLKKPMCHIGRLGVSRVVGGHTGLGCRRIAGQDGRKGVVALDCQARSQ